MRPPLGEIDRRNYEIRKMSDTGEELGKEAVSTAVQLFLGPIAEVGRDVVGATIGDRIAAWRKSKPAWQERNRIETAERATAILQARGIEKLSETARPEQIDDILESAKDASIDEIREIFARLMASAVDPARQRFYRREFAGVAGQLEPVDTLVLNRMGNSANGGPGWTKKVADAANLPQDEVEVAGLNLERLGLLQKGPGAERLINSAFMSACGRQFLACIAD